MRKLLVLLLATAVSLMAVERISGAGASFPAPVYFDWAYDYEKDTSVQVNYQSIGSGGGIKQITGRMVDFGASDKPLKKRDLMKKRLFQFPAVIGSIVVAYNIKGIHDGELRLKNTVVADIFMGKIKFWDDAAIKASNPELKLPHQEITVIRRADGSGTTYNFTYFLDSVSDAWQNEIGIGKSVQWPVGIGGKGNEGISSLLKQTPFSIGYVEYAYKVKNHFTAAKLQSAEGFWVEASEENVKAAAKYAKWTPAKHFYQLLALQPGKDSYPLVAATFILMPKGNNRMNKKVIEFFDWAFKNGDTSAKNLGYIPLPRETKDMIRDYWKNTVLR